MRLSCNTTLGHACALAALLSANLASAQITFYEDEDFRGRSFAASNWVSDFDRYGFNDRASSAVVRSGRWEVCEHVRFEGRCAVLQPGNYDSLRSMGMDDRISSVRPATPGAQHPALPPQDQQSYEYQRRPSERIREVPVTSARAIVGPPEQRCWVERQQVVGARAEPNVGGAVVGALIGGILGHQVGGGFGNSVATAGGVVAGGVIGSKVGRNDNAAGSRDVRRCENTASQTPAYWDVSYVFKGQPHHVQMRNDPGRTVLVNGNGEPRE